MREPMTPTITADDTRETHFYIRDIALKDTAPILIEPTYPHGGKEFLPDFARAKWNHGEAIKKINLSGYILKKNGEPSRQRADIDFITPNHQWHGWVYGGLDAPNWLLELFGIAEAAK